MGTSLRVSESTRQRAAYSAARAGLSIGELVDRALDAYDRAEFWRQTREALQEHPDALDEDPAWVRTTKDGLDRE